MELLSEEVKVANGLHLAPFIFLKVLYPLPFTSNFGHAESSSLLDVSKYFQFRQISLLYFLPILLLPLAIQCLMQHDVKDLKTK